MKLVVFVKRRVWVNLHHLAVLHDENTSAVPMGVSVRASGSALHRRWNRPHVGVV